MAENPPTTDRARRQRDVETGARTDAVDRVPDPPDPRGRGPQTTSRSRQTTTARDVAGELGIDRSGVGTVDRIEGMDVFLRSGGADEFAEIVQTDFASDADFVAPDDVQARVDADAISADPFVAPDRRDDVSRRARQQTASGTEFVEPADLQADVGAMGVTGLGVRESRRDDVAGRAQRDAASASPFINPSDVQADVSASGIESVMIAPDRREAVGDRAEADAAADAEFIEATDLEADVTDTGIAGVSIAEDRRDDVAGRAQRSLAGEDPFIEPDDIAVEVGAMGVTSAGVREDRRDDIAAREFEATTPLGSVDPDTDLTATGDGFGLTTGAQRRLGALQIDEQLPDVTVTADDVTLEDGQAVFEREVRR